VLGVAADDLRVGFVGRLSPEKGPDVLLSAAARIDAAIQLSFVGEGRERPALETRAQEMGVGSRVTWHGAVPDAARLLAAFDVLVLSSRTDGTPIVLFEAMAAGVPIVASAVGGMPELLTAADAVLVPPDDPAALAESIARVLLSPAASGSRAAAAGRRLEKRFASGPWLDAYEGLYRSVSASRRR